jgi:hypothetical protein
VDTTGKFVGMVTIQQLGAMGSQVLKVFQPMDAVHRLNGGGSMVTYLGLRYSRPAPKGVPKEEARSCREPLGGIGNSHVCKCVVGPTKSVLLEPDAWTSG